MTDRELEKRLQDLLEPVYTDIQVRVQPLSRAVAGLAAADRRSVWFVTERFRNLYPLQRYHVLVQVVFEAFLEDELRDTVWFELTPGEDPMGLQYPDDEAILEMTPQVLERLRRAAFFSKLDDRLSPGEKGTSPALCRGDFSEARQALKESDVHPDEFFDVLHVLMSMGAYCDCEILYNVAPESRLRARYWQQHATARKQHRHSPF